jgi:hypothetical protein
VGEKRAGPSKKTGKGKQTTVATEHIEEDDNADVIEPEVVDEEEYDDMSEDEVSFNIDVGNYWLTTSSC